MDEGARYGGVDVDIDGGCVVAEPEYLEHMMKMSGEKLKLKWNTVQLSKHVHHLYAPHVHPNATLFTLCFSCLLRWPIGTKWHLANAG